MYCLQYTKSDELLTPPVIKLAAEDVKKFLPDGVKNFLPTHVKNSLPRHVKNSLPCGCKITLPRTPHRILHSLYPCTKALHSSVHLLRKNGFHHKNDSIQFLRILQKHSLDIFAKRKPVHWLIAQNASAVSSDLTGVFSYKITLIIFMLHFSIFHCLQEIHRCPCLENSLISFALVLLKMCCLSF